MALEKRLEQWTTAGLITAEQAERIRLYERDQPSASWVLYGISGLGVTVLLTGVISILAANWEDIPASFKLILYFATLCAIGGAAWLRHSVPGALRETLLTAFGLFVLAGVGLIGQIYHLTSDGYQGIFLWLTIILPATLLTRSRLLNNIWFIGLIIGIAVWVSASRDEQVGLWRVFAAISLPYLFLALGYALGHRLEHFSNAARVWSYIVILGGLGIAANIGWSVGTPWHDGSLALGIRPLLVVLAAGCALLAISLRKMAPGRPLTIALWATMIFSVLLILPPLAMKLGEHQIIGCVLFIAAWSSAAAAAALMERKRLFDLSALVIGVRFIIVYFEVFGSLAATGLGLILSGALILGVAYVWYRYRSSVARAIRGDL